MLLPLLREPCDESIIRSRPAAAPCSKRAARWVLVATILASSMAFIDGTVVNVALPALQANLNATIVDVQWVIEAYSLLLAALLLVGGSLGDHYGRRRIFLIGVALFALASVWCGVTPSIGQLIAARAAQGLGAALLVPGSLAIISSSFPENERGRAIGTWSGFSAITTAIGPIIGGWLIEHVSWRAVFFINIPIALLVIFISLRWVPESSDKESAGLDWWGAIVGTLGLGALVYGLIESSRLGFGDRSVIAALVVAIALLAFFFILEARIPHPMLPLSLFRSRMFAGANLLTFLLYGALGGTLFFLPLNLIQVQHYSATAAGAAFLPFILIMFLLSRWAGGLVERYGPRLPLVVGPLIAACGFALFMLPSVGGSYWANFFPATAVLGLGMAISVAPLTTTVMNSVAQNRVGIASGVNNAVARSAGLIAIAALGIVMLQVFNHALDRRLAEWKVPGSVSRSLQVERTKLADMALPDNQDPATRQLIRRAINESFVSGFRVVMIIGTALALASAGTALTLTGRSKG
ncbi:MAG TPA: MFS transporter [Candidatus Limnocylindria bacterium]|jgi:EmrB/QacA subfamily drug resistance transporter|nr:MFS transporter [Candidatus Limnocylindria bacterium]